MKPILVATLASIGSSTAFAQSQAVAPSTNAPTSGSAQIVVTGQRPAAQTSIDRKIYAVGHDLQSTTGSVADVLRNLPSVDLDAQGNVSLRGDPNVQILIDGKPSTSMNAANRGETLQQLPANSIDRIEVMTNPSAQFKPDGTSGLINIVTKRNRKPGQSGSALASVGTDGRFNLGLTGSYLSGPLSINGELTLKRDVPHRTFQDRRTRIDPVTGDAIDSAQDSLFTSKRLSRIATIGIDYDLDATDRLSSNGTYNVRTGKPRVTEHDALSGSAGKMGTAFDRIGVGTERETNSEASLRYRHAFKGDAHELTVEVRRGESAETQRRTYTDTYQSPPGLITIDEERPHADEIERELSADYSRPFGGTAKLQVGYDVQRDDDDYQNVGGSVDPATRIFTSTQSLTNDFKFGRTIHALYGTLEDHVGKHLSFIGGLRLEDEIDDTNQVTTGDRSHTSYFHAYPTLHIQYDLVDAQHLRLSYSHRVSRPEAEDLNPYPVFSDPQNLRAGNPQLRPQQTHSFEAGYEYDRRGVDWQATLYLRKTYDAFTEVSRLINPTVLLTTKANLGKNTAGGFELTGSGPLLKGVKYNLSGNIFYNQIDASNLGVQGTRSTLSFATKASVDVQATPRDLIQVSANYSGRRLMPQGYRLPAGSINLGLRHRIRDNIAAVATVSDLFDSQRDRLVIDTPTLHDQVTRRRSNRTAALALTWTFAGQRKSTKEPQFDYSSDSSTSGAH